MVSLFTPGFKVLRNEQNVPRDGGGGIVCKAVGAHKCSSRDEGHSSDKQQPVINYKEQSGLTGQVVGVIAKRRKKPQTILLIVSCNEVTNK